MDLAYERLADRMHVVSLPLATRFRGVDEREVALFSGDAGWGEWSPFLEYGGEEASRWLRAALEDADVERPALVRSRIPVNATLPAVAPEAVAGVLARYDGCRTVKVKVPAVVGVPSTRPGEACTDRPGGRVPETKVHE